jgi:hypothetical protein
MFKPLNKTAYLSRSSIGVHLESPVQNATEILQRWCVVTVYFSP